MEQKYVHIQSRSGKWRCQIAYGKKKLVTSFRATPEQASVDADKLIYMVKGPDAPNNGTLTAQDKAALDGRSMEEVLAEIKSTGGQAFSRGSSAYRGVSWHKLHKKWVAMIQNPQTRRNESLGYYDAEEEAALAYDRAAFRYHGSQARLNFPDRFMPAEGAVVAAAAGIAAANPAAAAGAATVIVQAVGIAGAAAGLSGAAVTAGTAAAKLVETVTNPAARKALAVPSGPSKQKIKQCQQTQQGKTARTVQQQQQQQLQQADVSAAADQQVPANAEISDWWEDSDDDAYGSLDDCQDDRGPEADYWFAAVTSAVAAAQQQGLLAPAATEQQQNLAQHDSAAAGNTVEASPSVTQQLAMFVHSALYDPTLHSTEHLKLVLAAATAAVAAGQVGSAAAAAAAAAFPEDAAMQHIMEDVVAELYGKCRRATGFLQLLASSTAAAGAGAAPAASGAGGGAAAAGAAGPWRGRDEWKKQRMQLRQHQRQQKGEVPVTAANATTSGDPSAAAAAAGGGGGGGEVPVTAANGTASDDPPAAAAAAAAAAATAADKGDDLSTDADMADAALLVAGVAGDGDVNPGTPTSAEQTAAATATTDTYIAAGAASTGALSAAAAAGAAAAAAGAKPAPTPAMLLPTPAALAAAAAAASGSSSSAVVEVGIFRAVSVGPLKAMFVRPEATAAVQQMAAQWEPMAGIDYEPVGSDGDPDLYADDEYNSDISNSESDSDDLCKDTGPAAAAAAAGSRGTGHTAVDGTDDAEEAGAAAAGTGSATAAAAGTGSATAAAARASNSSSSLEELEQAANRAALAAAAVPADVSLEAAAVAAAQAAAAAAGEQLDADFNAMMTLCLAADELDFLVQALQHIGYPGDQEIEEEVDDDSAAAAPAAPAATGDTQPGDAVPAPAPAAADGVSDAVMEDANKQQQKQQQGHDATQPAAAAAGEGHQPSTTGGSSSSSVPKKKVKRSVHVPVNQYMTLAQWAGFLNKYRQKKQEIQQQEAAAVAAAAAADEQQQKKMKKKPYCGLLNYSDISSEEEEEYEAEWAAHKLAAAAAAAAKDDGSGPAAAYAAAAAAAGPAATGSMVDVLGISREGWRRREGAPTDQARSRRVLKEAACGSFHRSQIPQLDVPSTGDILRDTVAALEAVVAEGDADHIPSHYRAWRIAQLGKRMCPSLDLQALSRLPRPAEGDYCPVALRVPPPDPNTPAAAAAAAAAEAAAAHIPSLAEYFDPINRLPPQVVALHGCSYRGQKAVARRVTAVAAAAAAAAAPDGVCASKLITAGAEPLVGVLKPLGWRAAMKPGGAWPDTAAAAAAASDGGTAAVGKGSIGAQQAAAAAATPRPAAAEMDSTGIQQAAAVTAAPTPAVAAAAAAAVASWQPDTDLGITGSFVFGSGAKKSAGASSLSPAPTAAPTAAAAAAALQPDARNPFAAAASAASAATGSSTFPNGSGVAEFSSSSRYGRRKLVAHRNNPSSSTAAGSCTPGSSVPGSSSSMHTTTPLAADDAAVADYVAYVLSADYDPFTAPPAPSAIAAIAAAKAAAVQAAAAAAARHAAPVFTAHPEVYQTAEQHLKCMDPETACVAAAAATAAAAGLLEPQPMDVDWVYDLDLGGSAGPGRLWKPARDEIHERYKEVRNSAKQAAAAADVGCSSAAAAAEAERVLPGYLQVPRGPDWGSVVTGFIKADSCPQISAVREGELGIAMPRPVAIPHTFHPNTPAAAAAAAAAAGNSSTSSSSQKGAKYPAAGSEGDTARVTFGRIERQQRKKADESRATIDRILQQWKLEDPDGYNMLQTLGPDGYGTWCDQQEAERAAFWAAADATAAAAGGERVPEELMKPWGKVVISGGGRIIAAAAAAAGSSDEQQQQQGDVVEGLLRLSVTDDQLVRLKAQQDRLKAALAEAQQQLERQHL